MMVLLIGVKLAWYQKKNNTEHPSLKPVYFFAHMVAIGKYHNSSIRFYPKISIPGSKLLPTLQLVGKFPIFFSFFILKYKLLHLSASTVAINIFKKPVTIPV